jgi:hypothetical protein
MPEQIVALDLAELADALGRDDLSSLLRARYELGMATYGEPLTLDTPDLDAHTGCELADLVIYATALWGRGSEIQMEWLSRILELFDTAPPGIMSSALLMTRAEICLRKTTQGEA